MILHVIAASANPEAVIREVMAAQSELVTILGRFDPKLVKMSPPGEREED